VVVTDEVAVGELFAQARIDPETRPHCRRRSTNRSWARGEQPELLVRQRVSPEWIPPVLVATPADGRLMLRLRVEVL
jgi:hypothetical protein